ncbi:MAG: hypothetical protein AB1631_16330 [Acidobacteriota bacterium]
MTYQISFAKAYKYDTRETGISVPISLQHGAVTIRLDAKIDTGSSLCIFERQQGERLGLDIETGIPQRISAAAGSFLAYGHEITILALGIEVSTTAYFAADDGFTRNVLGRQGWLDHIRLGLIDYEGQLYLSAYDDALI